MNDTTTSETVQIRKKADVGYPVLGFLFCPFLGFISLHFYNKAKVNDHLNEGIELELSAYELILTATMSTVYKKSKFSERDFRVLNE